MKFNLTRTSYYSSGKPDQIEISSLEQLIELVKTEKHEIIIREAYGYEKADGGCPYTVEVYDDYRE